MKKNTSEAFNNALDLDLMSNEKTTSTRQVIHGSSGEKDWILSNAYTEPFGLILLYSGTYDLIEKYNLKLNSDQIEIEDA